MAIIDTVHKALISINMKSIEDLPSLVDDFELFSQMRTNKKINITSWDRRRFTVVKNTATTITFVDGDTVVNLIYLYAQGSKLRLNIIDASSVGFGQGGFGEGGFGGEENPVDGFEITGLFIAEGEYKQVEMINDTDIDATIDMFVAVYES